MEALCTRLYESYVGFVEQVRKKQHDASSVPLSLSPAHDECHVIY